LSANRDVIRRQLTGAAVEVIAAMHVLGAQAS
jgi:hypothetical protein